MRQGGCFTHPPDRKRRISPAEYCAEHPVAGVPALVGPALRLVAGEAQRPAFRFHLPVRQPETLLEELQGGDRRLGPGGLVDVAEGRVFLDILDVNAGRPSERKRVVWGKRGSVSVVRGGRRTLKKKK